MAGDTSKQTTDTALVSALRTLARDIQSDDGVANAAIAEAADRIEVLGRCISEIRDAVLQQLVGAGWHYYRVNWVRDMIDDLDARVIE